MKSHRETEDNYERFLVSLNATWRVIACADGLHFILQRRRAKRWENFAFCQTRDALARNIRERAGELHPSAPAALEALPAFAPDHEVFGRRRARA